jgi:hypothetical protein
VTINTSGADTTQTPPRQRPASSPKYTRTTLYAVLDGDDDLVYWSSSTASERSPAESPATFPAQQPQEQQPRRIKRSRNMKKQSEPYLEARRRLLYR